jgi:S1-C subfamily serine protease
MDIPSAVEKMVADATFTIHTEKDGPGQCVLVEGRLILTAAHCVEWDCEGGMTLGDWHLSKIQTGTGDFTASVLAVEPVSDIAVLGCPDGQEFSEKEAAFDELCRSITPVKLLQHAPEIDKRFPVWIRTHLKTWVAGTATYYGSNSTFSYETDSLILPGTSGGPIVNHEGDLVGVVSHGPEQAREGKCGASAGLLPLALPVWVIARIAAGETA